METLPADLLLHIVAQLPYGDALELRRTCRDARLKLEEMAPATVRDILVDATYHTPAAVRDATYHAPAPICHRIFARVARLHLWVGDAMTPAVSALCAALPPTAVAMGKWIPQMEPYLATMQHVSLSFVTVDAAMATTLARVPVLSLAHCIVTSPILNPSAQLDDVAGLAHCTGVRESLSMRQTLCGGNLALQCRSVTMDRCYGVFPQFVRVENMDIALCTFCTGFTPSATLRELTLSSNPFIRGFPLPDLHMVFPALQTLQVYAPVWEPHISHLQHLESLTASTLLQCPLRLRDLPRLHTLTCNGPLALDLDDAVSKSVHTLTRRRFEDAEDTEL